MRFLLALIVLFGGNGPQSETVDLIELNHYRCSDNYGFTQLIFWEWSPNKRRYIVRDWVIADGLDRQPREVDGFHECVVECSDIKYRVRSRLFRETFTDFDPERRDLKNHEQSERNLMPWRHARPVR